VTATLNSVVLLSGPVDASCWRDRRDIEVLARGVEELPGDDATLYVQPNRLVQRSVYRRRRLTVAALLLLLAAVLITAGRAVAALGDDPASVPERPAVPTSAAASPPWAASTAYVVRAGDTLWSIARTLHPRGDPRATVEALRRANSGRVDLRPGDRLVLP
jgi:hypothetical protein